MVLVDITVVVAAATAVDQGAGTAAYIGVTASAATAAD